MSHFDENLHAAAETKDQVEGALLLDVVVRQRAAIFQLLTGEDQSLLVRGNSFLVLNLGLHVFDRVRWLDLQGDGLPSQRLKGQEIIELGTT